MNAPPLDMTLSSFLSPEDAVMQPIVVKSVSDFTEREKEDSFTLSRSQIKLSNLWEMGQENESLNRPSPAVLVLRSTLDKLKTSRQAIKVIPKKRFSIVREMKQMDEQEYPLSTRDTF
jgi:hypothetical protein